MHHLYPSAKGDPLCPLGFHPQVRWPTRCKRCFRDYKEHGGRKRDDDIPLRRDDVTASSPSLSLHSSNSRVTDNGIVEGGRGRSWVSVQNIPEATAAASIHADYAITLPARPSSWTSSPDLQRLQGERSPEVTVNLRLPPPTPRKQDTSSADTDSPSFTLRRPPTDTSRPKPAETQTITINKNDSLAERVKKMQAIKRQNSLERESSKERDKPPPVKEKEKTPSTDSKDKTATKDKDLTKVTKKETTAAPVKRIRVKEVKSTADEPSNHDVQFLIQVKSKRKPKKDGESSDDDTLSTAGTETTETTLVGGGGNEAELQEQIQSLRQELEQVRTRCERAEREKSDILLRRLAAMDTTPSRTSATEVLKLQQKVNELRGQNEELADEKKVLTLRVKELEKDLESRPTQRTEQTLKDKLTAAETLCEELMDENEDMKRELRSLEDEIDEMQDNFREEQADEYTSLKKELEQTTKNCRILSFKLRKAERRTEQLEAERQSNAGGGADLAQRVRQLEQELSVANEVARRLQEEADAGKTKKKPPMLGNIGKSASAEAKVSRESLTRGGSQEDPVQLLRDLQDSLEREADLREQLRFAEEEAQSLRKKASRVEDDNESLVMQLKKMASKARSRKLSPTPPSRLTPEPQIEKDEGISEEEDPAELRLQLELNEQEASVLRRKVEELMTESETAKRQVKELTERMALKSAPKKIVPSTGKATTVAEQKIKVLEDEAKELRKKLIEKERDYERLHAELSLAQRKPKGPLAKSKSADAGSEQQALDLRRQLQVVEQEATVLRQRTQALEAENERIGAENKKLEMQALRNARRESNSSNSSLASDKTDDSKLKAERELVKQKDEELLKLKQSLTKVESERDSLEAKLTELKEDAVKSLPKRTPKRPTDATTKLQMKKMVEELESEIAEMMVKLKNSGASKVSTLETDKNKMTAEIKQLKEDLKNAKTSLEQTERKRDEVSSQTSKQTSRIHDLEKQIKANEETISQKEKLLTTNTEALSKLERKLADQLDQYKKLQASEKESASQKTALESKIKTLETNLKQEKEKSSKVSIGSSSELLQIKKDKEKWQNKATELETELQTSKKQMDKLKTLHEKEIAAATNKANTVGTSKKLQELEEKTSKLQSDLVEKLKAYDALTAKYEILEEEHVVTKAELTMEKESLRNQINSTSASMAELSSLRDRQSAWNREKQSLENSLSELKSRLKEQDDKVVKGTSAELERARLKATLQEKSEELEKTRKEGDMQRDQLENLRKEHEDLKKKMEDYDKVNKVQRNINADTSAMELELKSLRLKLDQADRTRKSDLAACKLRYDGQISTLSEEMQSVQQQVARFRRERDTYKQMLDNAQGTIADLKAGGTGGRQSRNSATSDDEDGKLRMATLEQQVSCLEDELCEARLEASRINTELVSERSTWEVKLSEMQSKVNELEEERLLASGRTRLTGTRTRMELAWQKEREEQQRLLQETSKLARDLRQTLFEVERERDKERLETKRRQEQLQRGTEEEQEENKRKVTELQCDLLELRDAHAKLRTANEKLRREKERHEREREELRAAVGSRRRQEQDGERRVGALLEQVDQLVRIAPTKLQPQPQVNHTPAIKRTPSQENSPPALEPVDQLSSILERLAEASDQLRRFQRMSEEERERDRARRTLGNRRAASTEHEGDGSSLRSGSAPRSSSRGHNGGLQRKSLSLSLDQGAGATNIWRGEGDSMSSLQSLDGDRYGRDNSLDSRLSGGSTQSEVLPSGKKKKKGLMGKLKQLTKSRSIDDHSGSDFSVSSALNSQHQGSDSDMSVGGGDHRSSKKDLKNRLTGMFQKKEKGSSSRSSSKERARSSSKDRAKPTTPLPDRHDSTQRPLTRNGSNGALTSTTSNTTATRTPPSVPTSSTSQRRGR